jgi:ATP-dependent DNA helicase RecG
VAICQHVHSVETGARAIEALASGIPIVTEALAEAALPPAHYIDAGIRFVAVLRQPAPLATDALPAARDLAVYDALATDAKTVAELETQTGLPGYSIRRSLRALRAQGLVEQHGGRGRTTTYHRTD